jgi:hypothetical protein
VNFKDKKKWVFTSKTSNTAKNNFNTKTPNATKDYFNTKTPNAKKKIKLFSEI